MHDREKVMSWLESLAEPNWRDLHSDSEVQNIAKSALELLKAQRETIDELISADKALKLLEEQESLLGIQQTADGITFISTGTAHQGEERGILLGKSLMHEWIFKELLCRGLLTDDIRSVFEQAKRI